MTTQGFNFMWLNLDLPAPPDLPDGSIREPLPLKYIDNVRSAGEKNPETQVALWVDSKRLTERQFAFLKNALEEGLPNVQLKDLRSIPAYDTEPLYNQAETDPHWRNGGQTSLIWRQVDAAKILVSLQGDFDQSFFADLDHAHLGVRSEEVQTMLTTHGLMIGSSSADKDYVGIENQLWGFSRNRRSFFEEYYASGLKCAQEGRNAWMNLVNKVDRELEEKEHIPLKEICLPIGGDGTRAEHTGHEWRSGRGDTGTPAVIPGGKLAVAFNDNAPKTGPAIEAAAVATMQAPAPTANYNAACKV